jgi:hypothetical protein
LGADQLGSDQPSSSGGIRWRALTVLGRLSVRIPHTPDAISVSGNRHGKTAKKKAGLFRPGLLPFKTPVSALILRSAASKKQQKKNTV